MHINNHSVFALDSQTTSLAELMSAFSYALDLTEGQPKGHSIRACYIAICLADAMGLDGQDRHTVYYATMLKDLGCSSNAARIAEIYLTDDRAFKHDYKLVGEGIMPVLGFVFKNTGRGKGLLDRGRAISNILRNGEEIARSLIATRCTRGADIARKLRFSEQVAIAISSLDEHWDGSGKPLGISCHAIPLASRIALLAQLADVFFTNAGMDAAREEIARRSGSWLDPELCNVFASVSNSPGFEKQLGAIDIEARLLALQPQDSLLVVDDDFLDDIAFAFGEVIDAKSPYTSGHSERVGDYFDAVATHVGWDAERRRAMKRAAILHDVGKLGVSSAVLEKPGKLDVDEWIEMRRHAEHTAEILGRISPFQEMARIAAGHHERLDGKGYPLGQDARMILQPTRMISVCDFYDALTADRPYRAAMSQEKALAIMSSEVGKAIDGDCFDALRQTVVGSA